MQNLKNLKNMSNTATSTSTQQISFEDFKKEAKLLSESGFESKDAWWNINICDLGDK